METFDLLLEVSNKNSAKNTIRYERSQRCENNNNGNYKSNNGSDSHLLITIKCVV